MPQPMRRKVADQVLIQLIEADVDIGFGLVDEAHAYQLAGQPEFRLRALLDADEIVEDIERRLRTLAESDVASFLPLLTELRDQISAAGREAA